MIVRACPLLQQRKYRIAGVAVLDVVEGQITGYLPPLLLTSWPEFTLEALSMMHSLLETRPIGFDSPEEAVEWQ